MERIATSQASVDSWEVLDVLSHLVEKSLVIYEESTGRYRLPETVHQYASERLQHAGERDALENRHRGHFVDFVERADRGIVGPQQNEWVDKLEVEHDNLRAALEWSLEDPEGAETGLRLAAPLWRFWNTRGHLSEGRKWYAATLSRGGAQTPTHTRAYALLGAHELVTAQGDLDEAVTLLEESVAIYQALNDATHPGWGHALSALGFLAYRQGDLPRARTFYETGMQAARAVGHPHGIAMALVHLGGLEQAEGNRDRARAFYSEAAELERVSGIPYGLALSVLRLGEMVSEEGRYQEARAYLCEGLTVCQAMRHQPLTATALAALARLAAAEGNYRHAACLLGAREALQIALGAPTQTRAEAESDSGIALLRRSLGDEAFDSAFAAGKEMPLDLVVQEALSGDGATR